MASQLISAVCAAPACNRTFESFPSQKRRYCCKECSYGDRERDKYETIACPCGNLVRSMKSWPRKYCSKKCSGENNEWNRREVEAGRVQRTCEQCKQEFSSVRSQNARFCDRRCRGIFMSLHESGANHWRTGKKLGRAKHLPPPIIQKCEVCPNEFVVKPHLVGRLFCCSRKCQNTRFGRLHTQENHYHWKGGVKQWYGPNWYSQRRKARERDRVCQDCGMTAEENGRALCVHHRKRFNDFGLERYVEANDLANLICLCSHCHPRWDHRDNPPPSKRPVITPRLECHNPPG